MTREFSFFFPEVSEPPTCPVNTGVVRAVIDQECIPVSLPAEEEILPATEPPAVEEPIGLLAVLKLLGNLTTP